MSVSEWQNLPAMFFAQAARLGRRPFLWTKQAGAWSARSYDEVAAEVRGLARGLQAQGVMPGDRVVLVAENGPAWAIADLAIMSAGGITVPAFTTNTTSDHRHVLTHSGAKGAILSTKALADRVLPAAISAPELSFIVTIEDLPLAQRIGKRVVSWRDAQAATPDEPVENIEAIVARLTPEDVACFIYTSGTGGMPKAVMLTHGSIFCNCRGARHLLRELGIGDEVFLCFLPLSHAYEHTVGQFFPMTIGAQIYYAESIEKILDNMAEARPTIMTAVPRLYEAMHRRILRGIAKASPLQRRLFDMAVEVGRRRQSGATLSGPGWVKHGLAGLTVRRKLRQRFGGRLKAWVSGGAALNPDIGLFFLALGVPLLQGYGQTEASPVISANPPRRIKIETVGPPLEGVEVRIAEDGEILVRSEAVMKGYWRDEAATAATIRDGWLHTGDIGSIDAEGYLTITDRKKDIIVLSGGDNVSPARVEGILVLQPEINQAMVHGDRHPHVVALLVPDEEFAGSWARARGQPAGLTELATDPEFRKAIAAAVDRVNAGLSAIERVRRFAILPEAFTTDNGLLTVSLKIRRHKIRERHGALLDQLYESAGV
jgi:long-chain acyl-CoA synthetase